MLSKRNLTSVLSSARQNYRTSDNLLGISYGVKYSDGKRLDIQGVQFFVSKKVDDDALRNPAPKFVYARSAEGDLDFQSKLPTDVIELEDLRFCCHSGDEVTSLVNGDRGTVTLFFKNKQAGSNDHLFITCSHVVGTFDPLAPNQVHRVRGGCNDGPFEGHYTAKTVHVANKVVFDVAAGIATSGSPVVDLSVAGASLPLTGFGLEQDFSVGSTLSFRVPLGDSTLTVASAAPANFKGVKLLIDGAKVLFHVDNLIPARGTVTHGNSGALIYKDNRAVGILVAMANDDWAFFHPLKPALAHLSTEANFLFQVFP